MLHKSTRTLGACLGAAVIAGAAMAGAGAADRKSIPAPEGHPLSELISGYEFRTPETQALQADDFQNPSFLWLEQGEELWDTVEGSEGKACSTCHGDASDSMATTGAEFPKWNADLKKPLNLEQQINNCRTKNMGASEWKWESDELLGMTIYVRHQSRGVPVNIQTDGPMEAVMKLGEQVYYDRVGQLNMSCSNCHEDNYGNNIRSDMLSQGHTNGFPTYRLKWQKPGSVQRRFKGCMKSIRATPYEVGGEEFIALEAYVASRGVGLPVETPAVRQ